MRDGAGRDPLGDVAVARPGASILVSACPQNAPPPAGYAVWKGSVPSSLSSWAVMLLKGVSKVPFGQTWTMQYGGQEVLARKDYHTWHYQPDGTLLTGICWPGITLYKPLPSGFAPQTVLGPEGLTPDPSYGLYAADPSAFGAGVDWRLVAESGLALGTVVVAFALALRFAGRQRTG